MVRLLLSWLWEVYLIVAATVCDITAYVVEKIDCFGERQRLAGIWMPEGARKHLMLLWTAKVCKKFMNMEPGPSLSFEFMEELGGGFRGNHVEHDLQSRTTMGNLVNLIGKPYHPACLMQKNLGAIFGHAVHACDEGSRFLERRESGTVELAEVD